MSDSTTTGCTPGCGALPSFTKKSRASSPAPAAKSGYTNDKKEVTKKVDSKIQAFTAKWLTTLKMDHAVLGVFYAKPEGGDKPPPFTLMERWLFLGLATACAWLGVYVKWVYLRKWIHAEDYVDFSDDGLAHAVDSALCAMGATVVDVLLGKEPVRKILKSDWESAGGWKGAVSHFASLWSVLLIILTVAHFAFTLVERPHLSFKLTLKFATTLIVKLAFVETGIITLKVVVASLQKSKMDDKAA